MGSRRQKFVCKSQQAFDFCPVKAPEKNEGSADFDQKLRLLLSQAIKSYTGDRNSLCAEMSRMTNRDITKTMLDSWTAPSRTDHNLPVYALPALINATGAIFILEELAEMCGCVVLYGEEANFAKLGQMKQADKELKQSIKELEKEMSSKGVK